MKILREKNFKIISCFTNSNRFLSPKDGGRDRFAPVGKIVAIQKINQ